jgi:hypothetical protein
MAVGGKRKNFTVSLDPDETTFVQKILEKQGVTLSGFVRAAISEFKENLEAMGGKSLADMSVAEFLAAVETFSQKVKADKSGERDEEIEEKLKG